MVNSSRSKERGKVKMKKTILMIIFLLNSASKTRDFSHADTEADFFAPEKK